MPTRPCYLSKVSRALSDSMNPQMAFSRRSPHGRALTANRAKRHRQGSSPDRYAPGCPVCNTASLAARLTKWQLGEGRVSPVWGWPRRQWRADTRYIRVPLQGSGTKRMSATIRPARLADQEALCNLYRQLNPADPPWPTEAEAADALSTVLEHNGIAILICEAGGIAVSTCMLVVCPNFARLGRPFALIENVVTDREHRKRGYGRQVVEHAIEIARQAGMS